MAFRDTVKEVVERCILGPMPEPCSTPVTSSSPWWSLFLAFEHEKIHLETSSVLMRQLPIAAVKEPQGWRHAPSFDTDVTPSPSSAVSSTLPLLSLPATTVTLGKPLDFPSFGWDNEYGARTLSVPAFQASPTLVTNADFLPFVEGGGYAEAKWWISSDGDDEGLRWRAYRNATHPSFWVASAHPDMARFVGGTPTHPYQKDDGVAAAAGGDRVWHLRAQFRIIPMPWDWPAEVNYLEASAFLRWKAAQEVGGGGLGYRMPTEAEVHVLRGTGTPLVPPSQEDILAAEVAQTVVRAGAYGSGLVGGEVWRAEAVSHPNSVKEDREAAEQDLIMGTTVPGNLNWRWHSPSPVTLYPPTSAGAYDMHGNVWQWLEDHFAPLPGFELHYLYDDFSTPCFDGWHTMILGGSWVSSGNLASAFSRYHFRRHFFQQLGFRFVKVEAPEPFLGASTVANLWEGGLAVSKELTNGYAPLNKRVGLPLELISLPSAMAYPVDLAILAQRAWSNHRGGPTLPSSPVLHLGCSVGRGTFELCRHFGKVVGVDSSEPAIRHARILQHHGQFEYERQREGVLTTTTLVTVPEGVDRGRAVFVNEDVHKLGEGGEVATLGPYAIAVFDSLLTHLRFPRDALAALPALVVPGGLLIITSNNNWQSSLTPRNSWLGGFKMNGEDQSTLTMLTYSLRAHFDLLETVDLAKSTTTNDRRLTVDIMQASIWRRKA